MNGGVLLSVALALAVWAITSQGIKDDLKNGPPPGSCAHKTYADNLTINLLSNVMYAIAAGLALYSGYTKTAMLLSAVTIISTIHHVHRNKPGLWTTLDESMAAIAGAVIAYMLWQGFPGLNPRTVVLLLCVAMGFGLFVYSWREDKPGSMIYSNTSHAFWHMLTATAAIVFFL